MKTILIFLFGFILGKLSYTEDNLTYAVSNLKIDINDEIEQTTIGSPFKK